MHHFLGKRNSTRRTNEVLPGVRGNRKAESERESGVTCVCVCVCVWKVRGNKTHEEEGEMGCFCTLDRFSPDGARTRAARVIRGAGLWSSGGQRGNRNKGVRRPGEFRTQGETVCVCSCVLSVTKCGDLGPV